jgi:hypothetical protein
MHLAHGHRPISSASRTLVARIRANDLTTGPRLALTSHEGRAEGALVVGVTFPRDEDEHGLASDAVEVSPAG